MMNLSAAARRQQFPTPQRLLVCVFFLLPGCATLQPHAVEAKMKNSVDTTAVIQATSDAAANVLLGIGQEQNSSEQRVDAKLEHIKGKVDASTNVTNVDVWALRISLALNAVVTVFLILVLYMLVKAEQDRRDNYTALAGQAGDSR